MKTLGVIGGMGPVATARFYAMFVEKCGADADQDNPDAIILSQSSTPDRTAYILSGGDIRSNRPDNPLIALRRAARQLESMGAGLLAIPCVTAHYFYDALTDGLNVPVLHIIRETAAYVKERGLSRTGVLSTSGTAKSGMFQRTFSEMGMEALFPDESEQSQLMELIYGSVKAGRPADPNVLNGVSKSLLMNGASTLVLGCTELSVLFAEISDNLYFKRMYVDALEVLAERAAALCVESRS